MLHAKVLRSPYAHAKIVRVDADAARALPGVHAVLTGDDTPTRMTGIHHKQHRILATGKVRFIGEEVVAVVADDEETARDAIDLDPGRVRGIAGRARSRSGVAEGHDRSS